MKPKEFLDRLDDARVLKAIETAEGLTSGEIRVFVSNKSIEDPMAAAEKHFIRMGMTATAARNGVLIFFAPVSQTFAIVGDAGIHAKCGPDFWKEITAEMSQELKNGNFTEAVLFAVRRVGDALAKHFPRATHDINELPNQIERD